MAVRGRGRLGSTQSSSTGPNTQRARLSRRLVAAFRKWLDTRGGGGPPTRLAPGAALPPAAERQEAFLDRHDTHTRHCPYCSGVRCPWGDVSLARSVCV